MRCQVFVYSHNEVAKAFWTEIGGQLRADLRIFSLPLTAIGDRQ